MENIEQSGEFVGPVPQGLLTPCLLPIISMYFAM